MMADPLYRTEAHEHYHRKLKRNRDKDFDQIMHVLEERNAAESLAMMREAHALWSAMGEGADYVTAPFDVVGAEVVARLEGLGYPRSRLDRICFGSTAEEYVAAQMNPYADDSGLVLVSDALLTLVNVYTGFVAHTLGPSLDRGFVGRVVHAIKLLRPEPDDLTLFTGLLRYYNIHQRVWGLAAKLGLELPSAATVRLHDILRAASWRFILAHEAAHFALGHKTKSRGFNSIAMRSTGELIATNDDQQVELDADRLAMNALRDSGGGDPSGDLFVVLGAACAIWATDSNERALFVRRGHTHPPGSLRIERIFDHVPARTADNLYIIGHTLARATEVAADFSRRLPPDWWDTTFGHPLVRRELHEPSYFQQITNLDEFQCMPTRSLIHGLHHQSFKGVRGSTGPGADRIALGDVRGGLAEWGVLEDQIHHVCDTRDSLGFHALFEYLFEAFDVGGEDRDTNRRLIALSGATLVARTINGNEE